MKKGTAAVLAAMLLVAWASAQHSESQLIEPSTPQITQQADADTRADAQRAQGIYTESDGLLAGMTWQAAYESADGSQTDPLLSGQAQASMQAGEPVDRPALRQSLENAGVWDLIEADSTVTLTLSEADIARAEVILEPADGGEVFAPSGVTLTPGSNGQVHSVQFPVSFADQAAVYDRLYCTVTVTLRSGDQCEFGLALVRAA